MSSSSSSSSNTNPISYSTGIYDVRSLVVGEEYRLRDKTIFFNKDNAFSEERVKAYQGNLDALHEYKYELDQKIYPIGSHHPILIFIPKSVPLLRNRPNYESLTVMTAYLPNGLDTIFVKTDKQNNNMNPQPLTEGGSKRRSTKHRSAKRILRNLLNKKKSRKCPSFTRVKRNISRRLKKRGH